MLKVLSKYRERLSESFEHLGVKPFKCSISRFRDTEGLTSSTLADLIPAYYAATKQTDDRHGGKCNEPLHI